MEVWDKNGELVKVLADLPAAEERPPERRRHRAALSEWQPLRPATLVWVEALDGGDPEKEAPFRDRLLVARRPIQLGEPGKSIRCSTAAAGMEWLTTPGTGLVSEYDWKRRWQTTTLVDIENPQAGTQENLRPEHPGRLRRPGERGHDDDPVRRDNRPPGQGLGLPLAGPAPLPRATSPFLDKMNLKTLEKKRLFACAEGRYEAFIAFPGESRDRILISSESPSEPPNYYLSDLKTKKKQALTDFRDPAPQLTGLKKDLIKYKRADGVELSGTLYLPPGYTPGVRLPVVVWAYPLEYSDSRTAGQVRDSPYRFTFLRGSSQLFFVTQGYAVLDGAQIPVIGDPKTMNDTYVEQIVSSAKAAIDALDKMGVGDPRRVGVGGHSYGAFMTANLLAHCDLFAAGIARSGAYNRTLTPFGFQAERRTLWEARDTYINMSPFMHADKINEPILLIHGEADNNSGTFPDPVRTPLRRPQGIRRDGPAGHAPLREPRLQRPRSILHVLAESFEWFDKYVKNKK